MYITQEKYIEAGNNNYKEWFIDNSYDIIFIPLVARDFLTAYLLNFENITYSAPDIDWVLEKLNNYDKEVTDKYSELDIKFKEEEVKSKEYYLSLLFELKDFVTKELEELNRKDFEWIDEFVSFKIKEKEYILKKDYSTMPEKHKQLLKAVVGNVLELLIQEESK